MTKLARFTIFLLFSFLLLILTDITQAAIIGDIDGDGDVDIFDYNFLVTNFGLTGNNPADLDGERDVDIFDYNILVTNFGKKGESKNPIVEQNECEADPRGTWKTFDSSCADYCWSHLSLRLCALVLTDSCDCGPDYCWTGQTCESNPVPTNPQITPTSTVKPSFTLPPPG